MKQFHFLFIAIIISIATFAQNKEDTADGRFHDDLLNNLVGKWNASGIVHDLQFNNLHIEAGWIMNHQYLQIHEKGTDTVPFIKMPWEAMFIIGYNVSHKRYVVYELSVRGVDVPYEGFSYATSTGNKLKISSKMTSDEIINQYFIWDPASKSWHLETQLEKGGKEGRPYLDLKAVRATSSN